MKRQSHKMDKHTQTICLQKPTNCLSVFDPFVNLAHKGLTQNITSLKRNKMKSLDICGLLTKKSKQTDSDNNESEEVDGISFTCSAK